MLHYRIPMHWEDSGLNNGFEHFVIYSPSYHITELCAAIHVHRLICIVSVHDRGAVRQSYAQGASYESALNNEQEECRRLFDWPTTVRGWIERNADCALIRLLLSIISAGLNSTASRVSGLVSVLASTM